MISMSAISSAAGAANYYTAQAKVEYYANEVVPSIWGGRGAEILGLSGAVSAESLTQILTGSVQETIDGESKSILLGRTVIDKETGARVTEHRAGWDLTFAPPKSVSIESEVFGRQGVRDAHEAAVASAMVYLEDHAAQTRYLHQMVPTGNLAYAGFAHATSRAGDPQTHTHVLVANVTYLDGKAYSLSNEQLLRQRTTADAVYRNELANGLSRLGYALDYDGRGNFEIAGYERAQLAEFSKRAEQIDQALQERGSSIESASYESRQIAVLATRDDKALGHSEEAAAHRERWQAEALAVGIVPVPALTLTLTLDLDLQAQPTAKELIASAAASLAEREQEFSKRDLVKEAMLQSSGRLASAELLAEISGQAAAGDLVARAFDWSGARFTTPAAIAGELWADAQIRAGRDGHGQVMPLVEFAPALTAFEAQKGFALTGEQRQAARQILTGFDQFSGVQGSAGTGKTTMLEFVREAAEARGWTVMGMSNGAAQASKLELDSGIPSSTTASFLARAALANVVDVAQQVGPGQAQLLYVNDEASMSGQRDFNGVIQASVNAGAKTVFVGDKAQHQSVAAGSAFERAQDKMEVSWLTQINRQTTEQARETVRSIIAGNHAEAIRKTALEFSAERERVLQKWSAVASRQDDMLSKAQVAQRRDEIKVARVEDNQAAIVAIARDYTALTREERERSAIITGTNADRQAINEAIRGRLLGAGELGEASVKVETLQRKDLTRAQAAQASSYDKGDVLKAAAGGAKARYLTVEAIDAQNNRVQVRSGQQVSWMSAKQAGELVTYTRQWREFAPGDRLAFLENSKALGVQNGDLGTVHKFEGDVMTVRVGRVDRQIPLEQYRQLDHGYVMTSHKSQGQTVDRTFIHHNTEAGMHGQREAYVNVTRARLTTTTYTQDRERAGEQAARAVDKTEAVGRRKRRAPGQAKDAAREASRGKGAAQGLGQEQGHAHGQRVAEAEHDPLAFVPARYADVTINPEKRREAALLSVPGLSAETQRAAQEFAGQAANRIMVEQAAREFAKGAADRLRAELTARQGAQALAAQAKAQQLEQAKLQREAAAKEQELKLERGRDRGLSR
jgi:conjugative relaxase-like TrwC/TraI family protein